MNSLKIQGTGEQPSKRRERKQKAKDESPEQQKISAMLDANLEEGRMKSSSHEALSCLRILCPDDLDIKRAASSMMSELLVLEMHGVVRLSLGILHGAPESLRHAHLQLHFETAAGLVQDTIVSNGVLVFESLVQNQLLTSSSTSTMTFATSLSSQQALLTPSIPSITSPESTSVARAPLSDDIRHPYARACVLWLIGQYGSVPGTGTIVEGVADWAPDVLRKAARSFNTEASLVKIQTLTLVLLAPTHRALPLLAQNVLTLARCDGDWDVRDRTRMLRALLIGAVADVMGNNDDEGIGGNWDKEEQSGRPGVVLRRERVTRMLFEGRTGMIGAELVADARPLGTLSLVMESESLHLHDKNNDKTVVDLPRVAGTGNRPFKREGLLEAVGPAGLKYRHYRYTELSIKPLDYSAFAIRALRWRFRTTQLRGPPRTSLVYGVSNDLVSSKDSTTMYEHWTQEYGVVCMIPSVLGQTQIVLHDPRPIAHFYARESWTYAQTPLALTLTKTLVGRGLLWSQGESHRRDAGNTELDSSKDGSAVIEVQNCRREKDANMTEAEEGKSIIGLLTEGQDAEIHTFEEEVVDRMKVLLLTGYETTSASLTVWSDLVEGSSKIVKRGVTIWMPRFAQCQCVAIETDSLGDFINVTAFLETDDEGEP
ncbi:hypothetical protein EDD22DRAFT_1053516 [Suillus occidentalis]|nr:hypothetical protein EDD22DRAFT_1053516 [Suillus occidentalis]